MGLLSAAEGVASRRHEGLDRTNLIGFDKFTTNKTLAVTQDRRTSFVTGLFNFSHFKNSL
jgi:hypothetical protein